MLIAAEYAAASPRVPEPVTARSVSIAGRCVWGVLWAIAAFALAGCGGSNHGSSGAATKSGQVPNTTSGTSVVGMPPVHDVGKRTYSGTGTKVSAAYQVGALSYGESGAPPQAVLNACGTTTTDVQTAAFVPGVVDLSYDEGRVPSYINGPNNMIVLGGPPGTSAGALTEQGQVALYLNGVWDCSGQQAWTLQPGQSVTMPFWIILNGVISNSNSGFTSTQASELSLDFGFQSDQLSFSARQSVTGPDAANCNGGTEQLMPYAKLPLNTALDNGGQLDCVAVTG